MPDESGASGGTGIKQQNVREGTGGENTKRRGRTPKRTVNDGIEDTQQKRGRKQKVEETSRPKRNNSKEASEISSTAKAKSKVEARAAQAAAKAEALQNKTEAAPASSAAASSAAASSAAPVPATRKEHGGSYRK